MPMGFSVWTLIAGFVFGIFGIFIFREGKRDMNIPRVVIGLVLMSYGFFVTNPWACWGIGAVLLFVNYCTTWANGS